MLGCIQPMSSPMMNMMLGLLACAPANTGGMAASIVTASAATTMRRGVVTRPRSSRWILTIASLGIGAGLRTTAYAQRRKHNVGEDRRNAHARRLDLSAPHVATFVTAVTVQTCSLPCASDSCSGIADHDSHRSAQRLLSHREHTSRRFR